MDPNAGGNWTQNNYESARAWIRKEFFKKYHRARRILENKEKKMNEYKKTNKNSPKARNMLKAIANHNANFERLGIPGVNRRTVSNLNSTLKRFIREEYANALKYHHVKEFIHRARVKVAERMMPRERFAMYRAVPFKNLPTF